MTVDPEPFRRAKRGFNQERTESTEVRHGKKHFIGQSRPARAEKKAGKKAWRPSENLLEYNKKKLLCYTGSRRQKRKVLGKSTNDSSIFNQSTEESRAHTAKRMLLRETNFNGARDQRTCTRNRVEVVRTYREQTMEYKLNRINSQKSLVFA
eukprot:TRINITY_DN1697_c0_g1_i2.p2 TRINITY_DN1697_c0_g1~~TRINITY_DN1697_c0_g1_i2.p2  ORF type:complete len:152 (-),score=28.98 TRINITY_DN1697_c0_g1_i2:83-538(-)